MKKTIAAMLVVCLLAVPAFAGGKSEQPRRNGSASKKAPARNVLHCFPHSFWLVRCDVVLGRPDGP